MNGLWNLLVTNDGKKCLVEKKRHIFYALNSCSPAETVKVLKRFI